MYAVQVARKKMLKKLDHFPKRIELRTFLWHSWSREQNTVRMNYSKLRSAQMATNLICAICFSTFFLKKSRFNGKIFCSHVSYRSIKNIIYILCRIWSRVFVWLQSHNSCFDPHSVLLFKRCVYSISMCENVRKYRHWTGEITGTAHPNKSFHSIINDRWLLFNQQWDSVSHGGIFSLQTRHQLITKPFY